MDVRISGPASVPSPEKAAHFRYLLDPLFLAAAGLYLANRFLLKPEWGNVFPFLRNHLDDCLLLPAALPPLLWLFRSLRLRHHDAPPSASEVLQWTVFWSVVFEWLFPRYFHKGVADGWDALSYALGGLVSWFFWNRPTRRHRDSKAGR